MSGERPTVEEVRRKIDAVLSAWIDRARKGTDTEYDGQEVADAIDALAARLEEVTRERDEARAALHDTPAGKLIVAVLGKEVRAVEDERDRLQAENERLRNEIDAAWFRCSGCGEYVQRNDVDGGGGHTRSEHHPRCMGLCSQCPIPVACGPVSVVVDGIGETTRETGGEKGGGRG